MTVPPSSQPNVNPDPVSGLETTLVVDRVTAGDSCVVHVAGELDLASRDQLVSASTGDHHGEMVIDLAGVTFMDCSGYGSVVAARHVIEGESRSLAVTGLTGQPARLWKLIADLENDWCDGPEI